MWPLDLPYLLVNHSTSKCVLRVCFLYHRRRAKSNLAYTQNVVYGVVAKSQQLEAQVILGAEEETTEMIGEGGSGEEGGEWEGEVSKAGEEELGDDGFGDDEVSPLSRV